MATVSQVVDDESKDRCTAYIANDILLPIFHIYGEQVILSTCFTIHRPFYEKAHLKMPVSVDIYQNSGK